MAARRMPGAQAGAQAGGRSSAGWPQYWKSPCRAQYLRRKEIECYTEPTAGAYAKCRVFGPGDELHSETLPNLRVPLDRLFG